MKLIDPFWQLNACFIKLNDWCTKSLEQLLKMNLLICKLKYNFECAFKFARNWMTWKSIWMELISNWLGKPILHLDYFTNILYSIQSPISVSSITPHSLCETFLCLLSFIEILHSLEESRRSILYVCLLCSTCHIHSKTLIPSVTTLHCDYMVTTTVTM